MGKKQAKIGRCDQADFRAGFLPLRVLVEAAARLPPAFGVRRLAERLVRPPFFDPAACSSSYLCPSSTSRRTRLPPFAPALARCWRPAPRDLLPAFGGVVAVLPRVVRAFRGRRAAG